MRSGMRTINLCVTVCDSMIHWSASIYRSFVTLLKCQTTNVTSPRLQPSLQSSSKLAHATRRVAGHSVIVLSTLVKGVGESFMLAGQATESITSGEGSNVHK